MGSSSSQLITGLLTATDCIYLCYKVNVHAIITVSLYMIEIIRIKVRIETEKINAPVESHWCKLVKVLSISVLFEVLFSCCSKTTFC